MKSYYTNILILTFILIVLGLLYKRFEDKLKREGSDNVYESIQKYLLNENDTNHLAMSKKPILWLHVPYEYNSRNWASFGSRSSLDLNQPYLYLTVKSILKYCDESFTICIIDDTSFKNLIPDWKIDMTSVSDPILTNIRMLGLSKLLYIYGGLICPISFVCMRDLSDLYLKGISKTEASEGKMFVCEMVDRNATSVDNDFSPSVFFSGAPKGCETVRKLCDFIERTMSHDFTAEARFIGEYSRWCRQHIASGQMNLIDGKEIGIKTEEGKQIIIDDLMSNNYLKLSPHTYGIFIPARELLNRVKFEWFARMSAKQVMESDTIIGNYILLSAGEDTGILKPVSNKGIVDKFVAFWKTPLYPGLYMVSQPNMLGDNIPKVPYTGR
jgi:hypothetical protein